MFEQVKQEIDNKIKTNGTGQITATRLNGVLQDMMDAAAEEIENVAQSVGDQVEANPTGEATTPLNKIKIGETNYKLDNPFAGEVDATDAERLQALANISNQEAGYDESDPPVFTGKMGYVVLQPEKAGDATTTFAAQIANKPNTIFEIRNVFDLSYTQHTSQTISFDAEKSGIHYHSTPFVVNPNNTAFYKVSPKSPLFVGNDINTAKKITSTSKIICEEGVYHIASMNDELESVQLTEITPIKLPHGCVLKFNGGCLKNGVIIGDNTTIDAESRQIFYDMEFAGDFIGKVDINWFGITYNSEVDNSEVLNTAISLASLHDNKVLTLNKDSVIYVQSVLENPNRLNSYWYIDGSVQIVTGVTLDLNGSKICCLSNGGNNKAYNILYSGESENIKVKNGTLVGDSAEYSGGNQWGYGLRLSQVKNATIENLCVEKCRGDGISLGISRNIPSSVTSFEDAKEYLCSDIYINRCVCDGNYRNGLGIDGGYSINIENSIFCNSIGANPESGIDIEPENQVGHGNIYAKDINIYNCEFYGNNATGVVVQHAKSYEAASDITIDNCYSHDNRSYSYNIMGKNICVINERKNNHYASICFSRNTNYSYPLYGCIIENCGLSKVIINENVYSTNCKINNCDIVGTVETQGGQTRRYIVQVYNSNLSSNNKVDFEFNNDNFIVTEGTALSNNTYLYCGDYTNSHLDLCIKGCYIDINPSNILHLGGVQYNDCFIKKCSYLNIRGVDVKLTNTIIEQKTDNTYSVFRVGISDITANLDLTNTKIISAETNNKYLFGGYDGASNITLNLSLIDFSIGIISSSFKFKNSAITIGTVIGMMIAYNKDASMYVFANTSGFFDANGYTAATHKGNNTSRPTLVADDSGFQYFDTSLGKYICWIWNDSTSSGDWYNLDGTALS